MLHDHSPHAGDDVDADGDGDSAGIRDIHALTPPTHRPRRPDSASSHRSSTHSLGSELESLPTMSREFNAMVVAGSTLETDNGNGGDSNDGGHSLGMIWEEETNPLAIVPDNNPIGSPRRRAPVSQNHVEEVSVHRVKKEEVESKISAWQTAEVAKVNNRFKREDVVINGWESAQVEKATAKLKKVERKLDEKRARAIEKTNNDVARARRKAEEQRASAEAKRGTKTARVLELANLMRAVGKAPSKYSFF